MFFPSTTVFTVTYAIPAGEGKEVEVIFTWYQEQVSAVRYAVVSDFITDTYTGTYNDAEGNEKELSVVYRLYVHAKTEGVALVISIHGYG